MSVKLVHGKQEHFPLGTVSIFNTQEEALAQAVADIHAGRDPGPVKIEDDDDNVLVTKDAIQKAAKA